MTAANGVKVLAGAGKGVVNTGKSLINTGKSLSAKHKQLKSFNDQQAKVLEGDGRVYAIWEIAEGLEDVNKQRSKYIAQQSISTLQMVMSKATHMFGGVGNLFRPDGNATKVLQLAPAAADGETSYLGDSHTELDYDDVSKNLVTDTTKDDIMKDDKKSDTPTVSPFRQTLMNATAALGELIESNGKQDKDFDYFDQNSHGYF